MAKQYVLLHDRLGGSTLSRADGYQSLRQAENCELCIDALESFQGAQGTMDIGNSQFRKGCRRAALKIRSSAISVQAGGGKRDIFDTLKK